MNPTSAIQEAEQTRSQFPGTQDTQLTFPLEKHSALQVQSGQPQKGISSCVTFPPFPAWCVELHLLKALKPGQWAGLYSKGQVHQMTASATRLKPAVLEPLNFL